MLLALRAMEVEDEVQYYPGFLDLTDVLMPDGWTGHPLTLQDTLYKKSEDSMRVCGSPYMAAASTVGIQAGGGGEQTLAMAVAIHSMPVQLASPDEVHYLVSFHEATPGGVELWSLGVTPSGRIAATTASRGTLLSPIGALSADSSFHHVALFYPGGGGRQLALDGQVLVQDSIAGDEDGPFSLTRPGTERLMLFNGLSGLTRCECSLAEVVQENENIHYGWIFDEGLGLIIHTVYRDGATGNWVRFDDVPNNDANVPNPQLQWYDPSNYGQALPWGPVPHSNPLSCAKWQKKTSYRNRSPVAVDYTPVQRPS